ncbi:sigma-70 family RNA polymerase sigma factor [Paraburkholderia nemoris]|uniref:sigma-70 family RNA polymerase sigma factor n=1 Tax=Paraburkholderia nemoris TaxID=2793076 RepID=UPI001B06E6A4|nr:sigma-70 family RNA polymerase sigma factor [Paraburkholderia nemoris]CAE6838633.1 RNA polymerase sigma factor FliA [Paraburkholderia nemoris]
MTPLQTIALHGPAVRRIAATVCSSTNGIADRDDLAQDGFVALLEMQIDASLPESQRHCYVEQRLRGAMLDNLRHADSCPRSVRRTLRAIARANEHLIDALGRLPTDGEIAAEAGIPLETYFAARYAAHVTTPALAPDEGYEDRVTVDEIYLVQCAVEASNPLDAAMLTEAGRRIGPAIESLPARYRHALLARYVHERCGEDIAAELGVTASRVSQMQKEALRRLREAFAEQTGHP